METCPLSLALKWLDTPVWPLCKCCNLQIDREEQLNYGLRADPSLLQQLAYSVQDRFNLALFGIDVIIENVTGRYAVIDINSFPGWLCFFPSFSVSALRRHQWDLKNKERGGGVREWFISKAVGFILWCPFVYGDFSSSNHKLAWLC